MRLTLAYLLISVCYAQNPIRDHPHWAASSIASLGASMADAATTSYLLDYRHVPGGYEANPVIVRINGGNNQVFGVGGWGVKAGTWAGLTALQAYALSSLPQQ